MKLNKIIALMFALMVFSSCASRSGESASTAGFDLGVTGIFLVVLGLFSNNGTRKLITKDNEIDEDENGTQISIFVSFICGAIAQYITVYQGLETWTIVGWAAGTGFVAFVICFILISIVNDKFKAKKQAYLEDTNNMIERMNQRGKDTSMLNAEHAAEVFDYAENPIRKISRIIGFVAFICIIVGGVCIYQASKELFS